MRHRLLPLLIMLVACRSPALAETAAEFRGHRGLVFALSFSPDGKTMATASFDGTVKLWDFAAGKETAVLEGHAAAVYAVTFAADGNTIATASQDQTIRLWNADGTFRKELKGHTGIVDSIAFSPDGTMIASGAADKSVRLWDVATAAELTKLGDHLSTVYSVAFSPNGQLLASAGNDGVIKIWDVKARKEAKELALPPFKPEFVEVPLDEKLEAEESRRRAEEERKQRAQEEKKKQEEEKKRLEAEQAGVQDPAKKQEEERQRKKKEEQEKEKEKKRQEEEERRKKELDARPKEFRDGITAVAFGPDSVTLYSVGFDRNLRIWNVTQGKEIKKIGPAPDDLFGLSISRDGRQVATAGSVGSIRVYDAASGAETFSTRLENRLITYGLTFTPDGRQLVVGNDNDNAARVVTIR